MDKSWIDLRDRFSKEYINGIERFIDYAYKNKNMETTEIYCPCKRCANREQHKGNMVKNHIRVYGFDKTYKIWIFHGESIGGGNGNISSSRDAMEVDDIPVQLDARDNMVTMIKEGRGIPHSYDNISNDEAEGAFEFDENIPEYSRLLQEAECDLYENCPKGVTELSFVVELLHMKQLNGWTNRSFTTLLGFLGRVFPSARIPKSYYQANKLTKDLGFTYETWDACIKNCMLFRNQAENFEKCSICNSSRYKEENSSEGVEGPKVALKKVRYFPLKPRLQKLFWSSHSAPLMKWHAKERIDDGVMRHPADSRAWKKFDEKNPSFARDCRNIRLGLASDGFNPFGNMSVKHSTWPVILIIYNLPPWLCMKQPYLILSILIDGPNGPGDKIDVFLQPLIDELVEFWNVGVRTYDASSKEFFQLHASLMWTINDFPAYAMLSGWSTKGTFACPCCNGDHQAMRLKHGKKFCYWGHRRFLEPRHRFRRQKSQFNAKVELRPAPLQLSGLQVLQQLNDLDIETEYKMEDVFKRREREALEKKTKKVLKPRMGWKKKSIFFELPYWKDNLIRHNLDVMHIEKNVCDNVLFTLLGTKGKTKDNLNSRKDLKELNIRPGLYPQPRGSNLQYIPPAEFVMSNKEKEIFLKVLRDVKTPDGFSSNISRCVHVQEKNISGLKSHDNHILLQKLLPIAARRVLPKHIVKALIELGNCFVILCSNAITASDLEKFEDRMALTLCSLEKIFPPSFFDVMEHLPIHLPNELLIAGCVLYRWMYPIERYLHTLKLYVRNRAHPEASIANSILVEECMTFCSRYMDVETKSSRPPRNDGKGDIDGRPLGKKVPFELDQVMYTQAHRLVLTNTESVTPFIQKHLAELSSIYPHDSQKHLVNRLHNEEFHIWFKDHVGRMAADGVELSDEIKSLSLGPLKDANRFKSYIVGGFRFRTKRIDMQRKTQNSGVVIKVEQISYSSRKDKNPTAGDITYYGVLKDIIEVQYINDMKFVLFKCDWVETRMGTKVDEFNFTLVNFKHLKYKEGRESEEPFILASQAEQVFYVQDPIEPDWHVVVHMTPRDRFDRYTTAEEELLVNGDAPFNMQDLDEDQNVIWARQGANGSIVDTSATCDGDEDNGDEDNEYENGVDFLGDYNSNLVTFCFWVFHSKDGNNEKT